MPRSPAPLQVRLPGLLTKNVILEHTKGKRVWVGILRRQSASSLPNRIFLSPNITNPCQITPYKDVQNLVTAEERYHKTTLQGVFNGRLPANVRNQGPNSNGKGREGN